MKGKHFSDNLKIIIVKPGRNILYNTKARNTLLITFTEIKV